MLHMIVAIALSAVLFWLPSRGCSIRRSQASNMVWVRALLGSIPWQNVSEEDAFQHKQVALRSVMAVACLLSILGGGLIAASYVAFKGARSHTREILLHLSLADVGVALANLVGVLVYFDRWLREPSSVHSAADALCRAQAFFAVYFTYASVLWTISLAVYLYFLIVHHGTALALRSLRLSYLLCYGLPLLLALWLVLTGRAGYSPYDSSGWCAIVEKDPWTGEEDVFVTVIGYDLWIYLAIVIIGAIYIAVHLYVRQQVGVVATCVQG